MSELVIAMVPPNLINYVWKDCIELFDRVIAKSHGEISITTIKTSLVRGDTTLVLILEGTSIIALNTLEVNTFETGLKVLAVPCTAGERLDEWMGDFLDFAHLTAKNMGCTQLRGFCRKGWTKVLKPYGWKDAFVMMVCDVE